MGHGATSIDTTLLTWATPTEARYLEAINLHGGITAAAKALGIGHSALSRGMTALKLRASQRGYSPDHDMTKPVPDGFTVKGVSTYYDADGQVRGQWVKSNADAEARLQALRDAAEAMAEEIPRLDPIEPPAASLAALANLYIITDFHLGAMAWRKEGGADWDLNIAERVLVGAFENMVSRSPNARVGVLCQLGDFLHADGLLPVTPTSQNALDADGRFSKVVKIAIRLLRRVIDLMLMKHDEVHVILAEGNHDLAGAVWLRHMFAALYENEPRVQVNDSELPFYAYQHGEVMLAFHHGHMKKLAELPLLFATQFAGMWGSTRKRYAHAGHNHHEDTKEHSGMLVTQHPTLAARDAYASRHGWHAERRASCITYHETFGKVAETTVCPEMLESP